MNTTTTTAKGPNLDDLRRLREEALSRGAGSGAWIKAATALMDAFPAIYETAKTMNAKHEAARFELACRPALAAWIPHDRALYIRSDAGPLVRITHLTTTDEAANEFMEADDGLGLVGIVGPLRVLGRLDDRGIEINTTSKGR